MILLPLLALVTLDGVTSSAPPKFWSWAKTPPMGWNSWDPFGTTLDEPHALAQADAMARYLKPAGYRVFTVDIQWYEGSSKGFDYKPGARLTMDANGRLTPALEKFPSAAGGKGFRPLADAIHRRGLEFGIHMMRGIPRQAVEANLPILGTPYHAADVADRSSTCPWNPDMFGVDVSKPGGQAYYDSVFAQAARWGVDFVKVDDLSRPYHQAEVEAIRLAIDKSGRRIVFSTSPGETPLSAGPHVEEHANQWRISDDFWDDWKALKAQFKRLADWTPYRRTGAYPDADMLPLGIVGLGRRSHFTPDEGRTLMTLWSVARSPLIVGSDLTKLDDATLALLTNLEVLAVDQRSENNRQLFDRAGFIGWIADVPRSRDQYLAVFNLGETAGSLPVSLGDSGIVGTVRVRDLWARQDMGLRDFFAPTLPAHGAGLYRLSPLPGRGRALP